MVSDRGTVSSLAQRVGYGRMYKAGRRKGILALPGATFNQDWWFDLDQATGEMRTLTELYGFPIGSCATLEDWGNSTMRARVSQLRTNCIASLFAGTKVHLMGVSAGGLSSLNWAKANPTLVQSISLLIPVVDVQAVYDNNRESFQSSISGAYGGRPPDSENPAKYAADLKGLPIRIYYSTNDSVTTSAETLNFAAAAGAETFSMGAVGHFWGPPWSGLHVGQFMRERD